MENTLNLLKLEVMTNFTLWHAEGLDWVRNNKIQSPMYWHSIDGQWHHFTFHGLQPVDHATPLTT